jgi:hypothetical protein
MNTTSPGRVHVLDASAPVTALAEIAISAIRIQQRVEDSLTLLEYLADWLRRTPPEQKE